MGRLKLEWRKWRKTPALLHDFLKDLVKKNPSLAPSVLKMAVEQDVPVESLWQKKKKTCWNGDDFQWKMSYHPTFVFFLKLGKKILNQGDIIFGLNQWRFVRVPTHHFVCGVTISLTVHTWNTWRTPVFLSNWVVTYQCLAWRVSSSPLCWRWWNFVKTLSPKHPGSGTVRP